MRCFNNPRGMYITLNWFVESEVSISLPKRLYFRFDGSTSPVDTIGWFLGRSQRSFERAREMHLGSDYAQR